MAWPPLVPAECRHSLVQTLCVFAWQWYVFTTTAITNKNPNGKNIKANKAIIIAYTIYREHDCDTHAHSRLEFYLIASRYYYFCTRRLKWAKRFTTQKLRCPTSLNESACRTQTTHIYLVAFKDVKSEMGESSIILAFICVAKVWLSSIMCLSV